MNADRAISKINRDMNAFNESGSREDKACAEGLRRARTYIQQEVLKRKILTHNQQVVLEWLKDGENSPIATIGTLDDDFLGIDTESFLPAKVREGFEKLTDTEQFQVLAAFAEWGSKEEGQ